MAILRSISNRSNAGEQKLWDFFKNLDDNFLIYHNFEINKQEFDYLIIYKNLAVFIIEVKGFNANNIMKTNDFSIAYLKNNKIQNYSSPKKQALRYRNILLNRLGKEQLFIPLVGYPFIGEKEFFNKELDVLSDRNETILREDLQNNETFSKFLNRILREYNNRKDLFTEKMDLNRINNIRKLFESENMIKNSIYNGIPSINKNIDVNSNINKKNLFEYFSYLSTDNNFNVKEIFKLWVSGVQIYLFSDNVLKINELNDKAINFLEKKNLKNELVSKSNVFNLYVFNYNLEKKLIIFDGQYIENDIVSLKTLQNNTEFNFSQYKVIHSVKDNLIVEASAGTGKTHTMISRLVYLIFYNNYSDKDIIELVALITFTNKATKDMKEKLKKNFIKYFLLTGEMTFMKLATSVDLMMIKTIDSFFIELLKKNGDLIKLGTDFSTKLNDSVYKKMIKETLNVMIDEDENFRSVIANYKSYDLIGRIFELLKKIKDKEISEFVLQNTIDTNSDLVKYILKVIIIVNEKVSEYLFNRNSILLSDVPKALNSILEKVELKSLKYKYLFIDEFQDTSNLQIDILYKLTTRFKIKLYLVGDVKQCIYRFRGAYDQSINKMITKFEDDNIEYERARFIINYRSTKRLNKYFENGFVKWNNFLDKNIFTNSETIGIFTSKDSDIIRYNYNKYYNRKDLLNKAISTVIGSNINKKSDYKIGILVRYNYDVRNLIKEIDQKYQQYLISEENNHLYQLESTIDFYKLILAFLNPKTPEYIYNVLTTKYFNNKLKDKYIKRNSVKYFREEVFSKFDEYLLSIREVPILSVLEDIVYYLKPWNNCPKNNRKFYKRNLEKLLEEIVLNFDAEYLSLNKISNILGIRIKTDYKSKIADLENENKIKIYINTIHKSKGLEYDEVIIPYPDLYDITTISKNHLSFILNEYADRIDFKFRVETYSESSNRKSYEEVITKNYEDLIKTKKNELRSEELRLLYVAMTRAKYKIHYFVSRRSSNKKETHSKYLDEVKNEDYNL